MTSHAQILPAKQKSQTSLKKSIPRIQVVRIINGDDEIKKHSRTSPEIQSKEKNEKLRSTLLDQQINCTIQAKTQTKPSQ